MPTYDYTCESCGHTFEHFQGITSRRLRKCPACHQRKLVRLVGSGAGLIFKGSGFYETDYKRAGASSKAGTSRTPTESSSESDATSSKVNSKSGTESAAKSKSASKASGGGD